jgi:hypothetical protein
METPKTHLKLEEFVYQVKQELLEAQEKHKGERGFLELQSVDLEVKVTTSYSAEGKAKLEFWVVNLGEAGGKYGRDDVHTVKLSFRVAAPRAEAVPLAPAQAAADDEEEMISFKVEGQSIYIPVSAVQMNLPSVEQFGPVYRLPGQGSPRAQELMKKLTKGFEDLAIANVKMERMISGFDWPKGK